VSDTRARARGRRILPAVRPCIPVTYADFVAQRPPLDDDDVHFVEALAAEVIETLSHPGDVVLDPFAGFGTTARVATRLGRRPIAVELLAERAAHIEREVPDAVVINGDSKRLRDLVTGPVDLVLTSPPYMPATDHLEDPLSAYEAIGADYDRYLDQLGDIFGQVAELMRPGGHLAINLATIDIDDHVTPLPFDLLPRIPASLRFQQDVAICWDETPPGIVSDHLLVFEAVSPD